MADPDQARDRNEDADAALAIVAEPLSAEAFTPFGDVIQHGGPDGRWLMPAAFASRDGAQPRLWVNRVPLAEGSRVQVTTVERHPFSAQNFLPLRGGRWLVVVAEGGPDAAPPPERMRAFVTNAHQGVTYRPGTWHHGLLALDEVAEVAVVMCLRGLDDDTQVIRLARPVAIALPPS